MYTSKQTVLVKVEDLKPHPKNPKLHADKLIEKSIGELGYAENIVIDENGMILSGHGRVKALKKAGHQEVEATQITGWTDAEKEKYLLLANQTTILGGFDETLLRDFGQELLDELKFGIDVEDLEGKYTDKITSPVYTPTGEDVSLDDLFETSKTRALLERIEAMDIDAPLKEFLRHAAYRFTVFNFQNIANYYARLENEEMKRMFEDLALVILDFDKAIENGYVVLKNEIFDTMGEPAYDEG